MIKIRIKSANKDQNIEEIMQFVPGSSSNKLHKAMSELDKQAEKALDEIEGKIDKPGLVGKIKSLLNELTPKQKKVIISIAATPLPGSLAVSILTTIYFLHMKKRKGGDVGAQD